MAPSESEILANYLLQPAPLTAVMTLEQFQALFPRPLRASPQLRALFRDLQAQRVAVIDAVAANVAAEARRGDDMRREVLRQRRRAERDADADADAEVDVERALRAAAAGPRHSLRSVVPELDGAAAAVDAEIARLRADEAALLASLRQTVGGLSDLRYGKLANRHLRDQVLDGLGSLQDACRGRS